MPGSSPAKLRRKGSRHVRLSRALSFAQAPRARGVMKLYEGSRSSCSWRVRWALALKHLPNPPLLPRDPWLRAHARELVQIVNAGTQPMQNTSVQKAVSPDPEVRRQWCQRWIERGLAAYEVHVRRSAGRFSIGDQLTMADPFLVPQVRNAERHGAAVSRLIPAHSSSSDPAGSRSGRERRSCEIFH
jgi:glutathione S-transferase